MLSQVLIAVALSGAGAGTSPLAFIEASHQRPGQSIVEYHPVNVLDGDPRTRWCAPVGKEPIELRVRFKRPVLVSRLVVDAPAGGVASIKYYAGKGYAGFGIGPNDRLNEQVHRLRRAADYRIVVQPERGANEVCVSELALMVQGKPYGGLAKPQLGPQLASLLGEWAAGPLGAPDRNIVFALDGTWRLVYSPAFQGTPRRIAGRYRIKHGQLEMKVGSAPWKEVDVIAKKVDVAADDLSAVTDGDYDVLTIDTSIDPLLAGDFNNAKFE